MTDHQSGHLQAETVTTSAMTANSRPSEHVDSIVPDGHSFAKMRAVDLMLCHNNKHAVSDEMRHFEEQSRF